MSSKTFKTSNFFGDMFSFFSSKVKSEVKYRSLSKQDFIDMINDNINSHIAFLSPISGLNIDELSTLFTLIQKSSSIKKYPFFLEFRKNLIKNAYKLESDVPFNSIITANKTFVNINKSLLSNIDKIVEENTVIVFDTKLSIYSFMGLLKQSEIYGFYSQYLLSLCMNMTKDAGDETPKYRIEYMKEHLPLFINITNSLCNTTQKYNFIKDLEIIRKKGVDFKVTPMDTSASLDSVAKVSDYPVPILNNLIMIPTFFNIFRLIGEKYIQFKHTRYDKIKDTKEWLESHVALLKLELSDQNQANADCIRLEKIIEKYDTMIVKYDKKLNDYLEKG